MLTVETGNLLRSLSRAGRNPGSMQENTRRIGLLSFGLGWRDRNKVI